MSSNYKGCFFHVNKSLGTLLCGISYMNNKTKHVLREFLLPTKKGLTKQRGCSYSESSHSFTKGV